MGKYRYVSVDVDLEDIDTDDLLGELADRSLNAKQRKQLIEDVGEDLIILPQAYLDDKLKVELFMQIMDHYSYHELYTLLGERRVKVGSNQLKLDELTKD